MIRSFTVVPTNLAEWDRFFRATEVIPTAGTVDTDSIAPLAVTATKIADDAVITRTIASNAVGNAELRDSTAASVIGRAGAAGDPEDIASTTDGQLLVRRAGALGFGTLVDADIPATLARDSEVTSAISTHAGEADPHAVYRLESVNVPWSEVSSKPAFTGLIYSGTGTPEGAITAGVGSTFHRTDGGAGTSFYVKESGTGNTGWVAK
ncbi:MAG: hypothetical protein ACKO0Z_24570 [Betaproteobacteria bacterium]